MFEISIWEMAFLIGCYLLFTIIIKAISIFVSKKMVSKELQRIEGINGILNNPDVAAFMSNQKQSRVQKENKNSKLETDEIHKYTG
jgi:hypothetical protein